MDEHDKLDCNDLVRALFMGGATEESPLTDIHPAVRGEMVRTGMNSDEDRSEVASMNAYKEGLIEGNSDSGFFVTEKGLELLESLGIDVGE